MMAKPECEMAKGNTEHYAAETMSRFIAARKVRKNSGEALGKCGGYKMWRKQT